MDPRAILALIFFIALFCVVGAIGMVDEDATNASLYATPNPSCINIGPFRCN